MAGGSNPLAHRFHEHLRDVWTRLARSVPGGWVHDAHGLRCIATGSPSPSCNLALSDADRRDPRAALDAAHQRFGQARLSWLLKLSPQLDEDLVGHARRRRLHLEEEPVYAMPIRPRTATSASSSASRLSIRVADHDTIDDAVACFADGFGTEPDAVRRELGPNLLTIPTFTVFVGELDGEAVATSMLATTADVGLAGIYSVATRVAHQGRGFGTALTAAAVSAAAQQGYDTAVLEPSPSGAPMYRRMGFEPVTSTLEAVVAPLDRT